MTEKPRSIKKDTAPSKTQIKDISLHDRLKFLENGIENIDRESVIKELDEILTLCMEQKANLAALMNCKNILDLLNLMNKESDEKIKSKYLNLLNEFRANQLQINQQKWEEINQIQKNMSYVETLISVDTDVAPQLEIIPLEDLEIDNFQLDQMLNEADKLLENHRVPIRHTVSRSAAIKLASGKVVPIKEEFIIAPDLDFEEVDPNKPNLNIIAEVTIEFENQEDDPIEDAFIEDLIPYNYEVVDVEINNEIVKTLPTKRLRKKGLELSWHLTKLKENEPIKFKYHLRPRISRTILVPTDKELQVIHTHSNLQDSDSLEGSYRTWLEFRNEFAQELNNVLLEDIIPEFYAYEVEEKKRGKFESSKQSSQFLVKWQLFDMGTKFSSEHNYQLTEFEIIEQRKREAERLLTLDKTNLPFFKRKKWKKKQEKARQYLAKFNRK
ncbi:MAG: hypothetical protein ACTSYU_06595 [Promethearchaeota archaeon]